MKRNQSKLPQTSRNMTSTPVIKQFPPIPPGNHQGPSYLPVLKTNGEVVKLYTTPAHLAAVRAIQPKGPINSKQLKLPVALASKKKHVSPALSQPVLTPSEKKWEGVGDAWMKSKNLHGVNAWLKTKTKAGSKGRKIHNFLTGAAAIVEKLAPAAKLLPFFMATHPVTQANAIAAGRFDLVQDATTQSALLQSVAPPTNPGVRATASAMAVGLTNNPLQSAVGINKMSPIMARGMYVGARIVGMDKLFDVPATVFDLTNRVWREGELIYSADLNPTGSAFFGTALIQQARLFNRYKVKNLAFTFVSSLAATQAGSLIMSITPDPDSPYTGSGTSGTQTASAVTGAETSQVWQSCCTEWWGDKEQNFYARAADTDKRFVSPGILNIVCNLPTDPALTGYLGSVYVSYEIEFTERSLEDSNTTQYLSIRAVSVAGQSWTLPFGTPVGDTGTGSMIPQSGIDNESGFTPPFGTIDVEYNIADAGRSTFVNIPPGYYILVAYFKGTVPVSGSGSIMAYNKAQQYVTLDSFLITSSPFPNSGNYNYLIQANVVVSQQSLDSGISFALTSGVLTEAGLTLSKLFDTAPYGSNVSMEQQLGELSEKFKQLESRLTADELVAGVKNKKDKEVMPGTPNSVSALRKLGKAFPISLAIQNGFAERCEWLNCPFKGITVQGQTTLGDWYDKYHDELVFVTHAFVVFRIDTQLVAVVSIPVGQLYFDDSMTDMAKNFMVAREAMLPVNRDA